MKRLFDYFRYVAQEKRRYRQMEARARALPKEYGFVYRKIQHYMWSHAGGDGMSMIPVLSDLLELFEAGVADGRRVLDMTGADVAEFCDELLRNTETWTARWHEALNRDIRKRFDKEEEPR
jgi:DNA-binding ferritin-like protein (Dps family)